IPKFVHVWSRSALHRAMAGSERNSTCASEMPVPSRNRATGPLLGESTKVRTTPITDAAAMTGRKKTVRKKVDSLPRITLFSTMARIRASTTRSGTPTSTKIMDRPKAPQNRPSSTSSRKFSRPTKDLASLNPFHSVSEKYQDDHIGEKVNREVRASPGTMNG